MNGMRRAFVRRVRDYDRRFARRGSSHRHILVDGRTPVNYVMVAPIVRAMTGDSRVQFSFTASEEPWRLQSIYADAPGATLLHPFRAAAMKFDAYLASDFMWATLLRETCRIQMFHGVGGKYGFDAPADSMRDWDRLFFVNRRRLNNFIQHGAIDPDSPAIRLIGFPKADCLVDGSLDRAAVLRSLDLDAMRPTVLYAPTWSPASSLNVMGEDVVRGLLALGVNVIIKLHDRSRDLRERYSGGIDWSARLQPLLAGRCGVVAPGHDICPYLVAADVMITDHSSAGFEFLLLDRPIVRIDRPALLTLANVHPDYAALLGTVSETVATPREVVDAVVRAISDPSRRSPERRAVAADLFHAPGTATARAVAALYEAIELDPLAAALPLQEAGMLRAARP